jgi:hypothetical protein
MDSLTLTAAAPLITCEVPTQSSNAGGARASQSILNVIGDAIAIDTGFDIDDHVLDEQPATSTCTFSARTFLAVSLSMIFGLSCNSRSSQPRR